jgi:hypothetical protein
MYTNADIVRILRRLADDIDEPGADEWDAEGVIYVIRGKLDEWPVAESDDDECDHGDAYCAHECQACGVALASGDLRFYHRGGCPTRLTSTR